MRSVWRCRCCLGCRPPGRARKARWRALTGSLATLLIAIVSTAPSGGTLTIQVDNVRSAKGLIHVDICREARFLRDDCEYAGEAPARVGRTTVIVRGLPAGRYAAQAFQDENSNGKLDRALFGIPKEGVGFSRDAPIRLAPPKFDEAMFDFSGGGDTIHFHLRYFLGASGPRASQ